MKIFKSKGLQTVLVTIMLLVGGFVNAQINFWGMTSAGGAYGAGTIFKTDGSGNNQQVAAAFLKYEGLGPVGNLIETANGKLYGMTNSGGANSKGILFEYDPATATSDKKIDFDGTANGSFPIGSLLEASNGKLYGMTNQGGANSKGVLFEYDPVAATVVNKFDFDGTANGQYPSGSLLEAANGKLYGITSSGGANSKGVLFEYDPATATVVNKFDFDGTANGQIPSGSLLEAANGKLYGVTSSGGANSKGVLFEYDPATAIVVNKFDFDGTANGQNPSGSLMEASNGKLYGMTYSGGANSKGVLFEYDPATATVVNKFDFDGTANGQNPRGSLMEASNGKLYGMTRSGGANNFFGVLFEYDPATTTLVNKFDFDGTANGKNPEGSLMEAANGKLYGMANLGGEAASGVLFEYNPATAIYAKKFDFGAVHGESPYGDLMKAANGKLYGMTNKGGANNRGVLFEYNPATATIVNKFDFDGTANYPEGSLMEAANGKLYGMTRQGGTNNKGVLFEYDPATATVVNKFDFDGTANGQYPYSSLIEAANGKLYGMTSSGGANSKGVLFEYDPATATAVNKFDFDGTANGQYPYGSLMEAANGKLYGMTSSGGANYLGVLFEYDPATATVVNKFDFDGTANGRSPQGSLMEAANGKLYGMTRQGGTNDLGVLFEYDPATATVVNKFDFDGTTNGQYPYGNLMEASNGKLYGMTRSGGANNYGVLFEYDPATATVIKKLDFDGTNGQYPQGNLIEISCTSTTSSFNITACTTYTVPSGDETYNTPGTITVNDTIYNSCGSDSVMTITVTILAPLTGTNNTTICANDSVVINGTTYDAANPTGTEVFTNIGTNNCDSTVTVSLNVLPAITGTDTQTACVSYTWIDGTTYTNSNSIATFNIVGGAANGCDSLVTLNLTINTVDTSVTDASPMLSANASGATYQWLDCDNGNNAIAGATNQSYTATANGNYAVAVTQNGCTDTSACITISGVGIDENSFVNNVSIYPNPTTGTFTVGLDKLNNNSVITIYSVVGQEIINQKMLSSKIIIDLKNHDKGIYFIKIQNGNKIITKRIVKQ